MIDKKELLMISTLKDIYQNEIDEALKINIYYGHTRTKIVRLGDRPIFNFKSYELKAIFEPYKDQGYEIIYGEDEVILDWEAD